MFAPYPKTPFEKKFPSLARKGIYSIVLLFVVVVTKLFSPGDTHPAVSSQVITPAETPVETPVETPIVSLETSETPEQASEYEYYQVTSVVDGDTIKINLEGKVVTLRLIGIDTPETVDPRRPVECFGKEASNKAKEFLLGQKVRIEKDQSQGEVDRYGRTLAYVFRDDGIFFNKYMIEQGYAYEYTYNAPYKYQVEFKAAQKAAQRALVGLWSPDTCSGTTGPVSE